MLFARKSIRNQRITLEMLEGDIRREFLGFLHDLKQVEQAEQSQRGLTLDLHEISRMFTDASLRRIRRQTLVLKAKREGLPPLLDEVSMEIAKEEGLPPITLVEE